MLEEHRAKQAEKHYETALAAWQAERDGLAHLIDVAGNDQWDVPEGVILHQGEDVVFTVTGAGLIEDRRGAGHWVGGSQGVSIPIGSLGGRSVRYRVGATRGHYVQAPPTPTAIDTGNLYITTRRVLFIGGKQTRECAFDKLVGFTHDDTAGESTFAVSNRQKATVIHYGPKLADAVDFRLDLALARFHGTTDQLIAELQKQIEELDSHRPQPPQPAPPQPAPPQPAPPQPVPPQPAPPQPAPPQPAPPQPAPPQPAPPQPAPPAAAGAPPATPPGFVIMSPDGFAWWDGYAWIPVARATPGWAIRSEDGRWWWDGRAWRLVV